MKIGKIIRTLRIINHLTQENLEEKIGIDGAYISLIETGKREPSRRALKRFSKAFKIPVIVFHILESPLGKTIFSTNNALQTFLDDIREIYHREERLRILQEKTK